jgi:hypothetical protein
MLRGEGTTAAVLIDLLGRTCGGVDEGFVAVFVKAEPSRLLNYGRRGGRRLMIGGGGFFCNAWFTKRLIFRIHSSAAPPRCFELLEAVGTAVGQRRCLSWEAVGTAGNA